MTDAIWPWWVKRDAPEEGVYVLKSLSRFERTDDPETWVVLYVCENLRGCLNESFSWDQFISKKWQQATREEAIADGWKDERGMTYKFDSEYLNDVVTRSAPRWAWDIIDETLGMDAHSSAFDRDLRKDIKAAIDAMSLCCEEPERTELSMESCIDTEVDDNG